MSRSNLPESSYDPYYQVQSRTYIYYSRYPSVKPLKKTYTWRHQLRRIGMYARLAFVAGSAIVVGGILPLALSYQLFFRSLIDNNCSSCMVIGAQPYFEFDYILATMLAVVGFIIPILVLYLLIQIMRSRVWRHELFH
jgi:hypothetical protein